MTPLKECIFYGHRKHNINQRAWAGWSMTSDIPSNGEIISAVSVSKNYGATRALNEVSVAINPGEVHALVGENGAGKSTLAKILAGAVLPSSGHLQIAGVPVHFARPRDALRAGIAIVQQELALLPPNPSFEMCSSDLRIIAQGFWSRVRFGAVMRSWFDAGDLICTLT